MRVLHWRVWTDATLEFNDVLLSCAALSNSTCPMGVMRSYGRQRRCVHGLPRGFSVYAFKLFQHCPLSLFSLLFLPFAFLHSNRVTGIP